MQLDKFFSSQGNNVVVSRQQASNFAKEIAGDFNPIHDVDAKRFCVPGDLLFALGLYHYGLSQAMCFNFGGMVSDNIPLAFPASEADTLSIADGNGKEYLNIERSGSKSDDQAMIAQLIQGYVEFSGQTFPQLLVPLMREQGMMINPDRPLVIYERMSIKMDRLDIQNPSLELDKTSLEVEGKRGNVSVQFLVKDGADMVGHGEKNIVLSGLRAFDQDKIDALVSWYDQRKNSYSAA